jgi:hypothetical protein
LLGCVSFAGDPIGYVSFAGDPIGYARVLGLVSSIATHGHLFSHIRDARCYCSSLSSPSDTTHSLSAYGHSRFDNNNRALSLLRRSLARSLCSDVPASLSRFPPPAARALRIALNFSPQKVGAVAAGWQAACVTAKGVSGRRPRHHPKQTPLCPLP